MSKYRPERIELKAPTDLADRFAAMLSETLAPAAKLQRLDKGGEATFAFSPTKGEYILVRMRFSLLCKELGGVPQGEEPEQICSGCGRVLPWEELSPLGYCSSCEPLEEEGGGH